MTLGENTKLSKPETFVGQLYPPASVFEKRSYLSAHSVHGELLKNCHQVFANCVMSAVWSLDPLRGVLIFLRAEGIDESRLKETRVLDVKSCLSGATLESKVPLVFDDVWEKRNDHREISHAELIREQSLTTMVSVPVLDSANPHQVLLVVNLFFHDRSELPMVWNEVEPQLEELARIWAVRFEDWLQARRLRFANRLAIDFCKLRSHTEKHLCNNLALLIPRAIDCDSVAIYLEGVYEAKLELRSFVGPTKDHQKTRQLTSGAADQCWRENREWLCIDMVKELGMETVESQGASARKTFSGAFVPLRDFSGKAKGVVRCMNGPDKTTGGLLPFTYEDVAIIEAISQAFASQLDMLLADRKRLEIVTHLAHEIGVPVTAFRAIVERLQHECVSKQYEFEFDYFDEIGNYTAVMDRRITELEVMRSVNAPLILETEETFLFRYVLEPARKSLTQLLRKKRLSASDITSDGIREIPELYVDRILMTQVVFNLLANAIKYFDKEPKDFWVKIEASKVEGGFELNFRDNGMGIPAAALGSIFESGFRAENAVTSGISGFGIGLWMSRKIIRQHGGTIKVRSNRNPTELVVFLPRELVLRAPRGTIDDS